MMTMIINQKIQEKEDAHISDYMASSNPTSTSVKEKVSD